ncbi:glycoside hydrolase [Phaffia rhodozyma]|uniref:Glycoside hydrolase n=1 Tax=Phaffia rhodozyma TaxID=264483 RepID=A0A0F7SK26_PHARH|nr:glycoside hydrolase [Phaffia rhodozyma]
MSLSSSFSLSSVLSAMGLVASIMKPVPLIGDILSADGGLGIGYRTANCSAVDAYEKSVVSLEEFAPFDQAVSSVYRYRQQQSVNLGSWFAQEAWMNPSLFACASGNKSAELDVATGFDGNTMSAQYTLERHWDEWITEDDFAHLQKIGINTVRLPIGYWSLGPDYVKNTPFEKVSSVYANSWPRVVRSINWAAKYGLGVLVDMHGAPGSQNGQAHSGLADGVIGFFDSKDDQDSTICALTFLTEQLVNVTNVVGIQILNEPSNDGRLPDFYTRALDELRKISPAASSFPFYIHDAFDLPKFADFVAKRPDFVVVDHHQYFVFAPQDPNESTTDLTGKIKNTLSTSLNTASLSTRNNMIIGEWSAALSQASLAKETNPVGARQAYTTGQMATYANTSAGWAFWSYKTENCDTDQDWCFKNAVGKSLPSTFFSFPGSYSSQSIDGAKNSSVVDGNLMIDSLPAILSPVSSLVDAIKAIKIQPLASIITNLTLSFAHKVGQEPVQAPESRKRTLTKTAFGIFQILNGRDVQSKQALFRDSKLPPGKFRARALREEATTAAAILGKPNQGADGSDCVDDGSETLPLSKTSKSNSTISSSNSSTVMSFEEAAIAKGYSDGFQTAKFFAQTNGSRLGFATQYVCDSLWALGEGSISSDQHDRYEASFFQGLYEAEAQVEAAIADATAPTASGSARQNDIERTLQNWEMEQEDPSMEEVDNEVDEGDEKEEVQDEQVEDDETVHADDEEDEEYKDEENDEEEDDDDDGEDEDEDENLENSSQPLDESLFPSNSISNSTSSASEDQDTWDSGLLDSDSEEPLKSLWDEWAAKTSVDDRVIDDEDN